MVTTNRSATFIPYALENTRDASMFTLERINDLAKLVGDARRGVETVNDNTENSLLEALFLKLHDMHERHFMKLAEILER
ncbi:MAG: hypothetical protein AAFU54_25535 [Chloroflexota bacterium]